MALAGKSLDEIERMAIIQTLAMCNGNKADAARHLGIAEKSVTIKFAITTSSLKKHEGHCFHRISWTCRIALGFGHGR
jgi:DNA-binding NtrC family response regulator